MKKSMFRTMYRVGATLAVAMIFVIGCGKESDAPANASAGAEGALTVADVGSATVAVVEGADTAGGEACCAACAAKGAKAAGEPCCEKCAGKADGKPCCDKCAGIPGGEACCEKCAKAEGGCPHCAAKAAPAP